MLYSKIKKNWPLLAFTVLSLAFFWKFFFQGLLPIPADTIVGMYHPWREVVWDGFGNGVPFKNFLITDPVRQQYPWRYLSINLFKKGQLPVWNPYTHTGQPLLANWQSAAFYPLNIFFFLFPFNFAWGLLIFLQPLLAGLFTYFYLRELKLKQASAFLGGLAFSFSGFFMAWLEWGTILHAALWLPLALLSIEKFLTSIHRRIEVRWGAFFFLSLAFSFLAGHLQTSFYLLLFSLIYLVCRVAKTARKKFIKKTIVLFAFFLLVFIITTSIQWWPSLRLIKLSARGVDLNWQKSGWFLPWQNLVQFLVPDFFGNPTTLNYWGEWNYGEFIGYIGIIPLILGGLGVWTFWKKGARFFTLMALVALSFALPTPWAKLPFQLNLPFLATSQPTRLLFLVDFCLSVLAAFGLEGLTSFQKKRFKGWFVPAIFAIVFLGLWVLVNSASSLWPGASWLNNLSVSGRNLFLPTAMAMAFGGLIFSIWLVPKILKKKRKLLQHSLNFVFLLLFLLVVFDLFRFGWKFNPFVKEDWLFPSTQTIKFLQQNTGDFRVMSTDSRLLPPNFGVVYRIQVIDGYDPLYLYRYGELVAASERGRPDISPPFGFNRIITPQRYDSPLIDLMGVKYILSLTDLASEKLALVFQEGETRVYENKKVLPRAFMVYDYRVAENKQAAISQLMGEGFSFTETVVLEAPLEEAELSRGEGGAEIISYSENKVVLGIETDQEGLLVLTDAFYPGWEAMIDGRKTEIFRADYHFRGVVVPKGEHQVIFER